MGPRVEMTSTGSPASAPKATMDRAVSIPWTIATLLPARTMLLASMREPRIDASADLVSKGHTASTTSMSVKHSSCVVPGQERVWIWLTPSNVSAGKDSLGSSATYRSSFCHIFLGSAVLMISCFRLKLMSVIAIHV